MTHARTAVLSVLAILLVVFGGAHLVAYGSPLTSASPVVVPDCPTPTGTISEAKHYAYNRCRFDRVEALAANQHPVPTVTQTVTTTVTAEASPSATSTPTSDPTTFPNASTTGVPAGTTLTAYSGPSTISTANTVLTGKRFGCITVTAPGVIIRNSTFTCTPSYAVVEIPDRGYTGTPLLLEDVEISCGGPGNAVGEAHVILRRVNIHDCENGVDVNQDITVEDSYIHDLYNGNDAHADGIQFASRWNGSTYVQGAKDVVVRHNTIYSADSSGALGTSALISNPKGDENILIENNLLAGGAYTLYCPTDAKGLNYRVTGNHFSTRYSPKVGAFGPSTGCSDEDASGNVVHETGAALALD